MGDWLLNLPIPWMALVIFVAIYLVTAAIYLTVIQLAVGDRARAFKALSPGMLPVLGTIFALQGSELFIFQVRDHGALLAIAGKARNALQYEIGNPLTATLMTRHWLLAALYAPIGVVLYENDAGHGVFEYDQPSTTFGQVGDERVTAVARGLDASLERVLQRAAE
jgi:hypothetical protein